jgi:putative membrane protein
MTQNPSPPPGSFPIDETVTSDEPGKSPPSESPGPPVTGDASPPDGRPRRSRPFFFGALAVFLGGAVLIETVLWMQSVFDRNQTLGYAISGLCAIVLLAAGCGIRGAWRQMNRLASAEGLRAEAAALLRKNSYGHAEPFLERVGRTLRQGSEFNEKLESFRRTILDTHTDLEILTLFDRDFLRPLDERAHDVIIRHATQTALGVSLSPLPALDALVVLARSADMIREVAEVYGFRPGWIATLNLARRALVDSASIAAVDIMGKLWSEYLGSRVASFLTASLAQGLLGAVRMARLGIAVAEQCRPMPPPGDQESPMKIISRRVMARLSG